MSRALTAVAVGTIVLGLAGCGPAPGGGASQMTTIEPADCPGGVMSRGTGGRDPAAKGYATAVAAGEVLRADVDSFRTNKLTKEPARVETRDPERVRLFYADAAGKVVLQVDVVREGSAWFPDSTLGCGKES